MDDRYVNTYRIIYFFYFCIPLTSLKANITFSIFLKLGPTVPKALTLKGSSMVELGDNLYIIGGQDSNSGPQREIHQLSCVSGLCSWKTLTQQLKTARAYLVAIPVNDIFCA